MTHQVTYVLNFYEDYRANFSYKFRTTDEPEDFDYDIGEFTVQPARPGRYNIYIVGFDDNTYTICCDYVTDTEEGKAILLQILAHIQETGPFQSTGWTVSYKQKGSYADPVPVTDLAVQALDTNPNLKPCVAISVDEDGAIVDYISITPIQ